MIERKFCFGKVSHVCFKQRDLLVFQKGAAKLVHLSTVDFFFSFKFATASAKLVFDVETELTFSE